jgi:16S rRNA (guanine1516-N2)-methyltransferase
VAIGELPAFGGLLAYLGIPRFPLEPGLELRQRLAQAPADAFVLIETEDGLELRPPGEATRVGIRARFPPDASIARSGARTPLAKAFGNKITTVFDLTAGLGGDAYRLAAAGYHVRAWERHPVVFALLTSGWGACVAKHRVPEEIVPRISFRWAEASEATRAFEGSDVGAYFDPMYPPPKRSSALPKRPLQVLRDLLRDDEGPEPVELVHSACERLPRVVVKRPHHAPPIVPDARFAVETKLVRFDVYLNPARMEAAES